MIEYPISVKCQRTNCYWNVCENSCASYRIVIENNQSTNANCLSFVDKEEVERRLNAQKH